LCRKHFILQKVNVMRKDPNLRCGYRIVDRCGIIEMSADVVVEGLESCANLLRILTILSTRLFEPIEYYQWLLLWVIEWIPLKRSRNRLRRIESLGTCRVVVIHRCFDDSRWKRIIDIKSTDLVENSRIIDSRIV